MILLGGHSPDPMFENALKNFSEALKISEKLGDLKGKANGLNNIAGIYYVAGDYEEESELVFWGEWEAQSNIDKLNNTKSHLPTNYAGVPSSPILNF